MKRLNLSFSKSPYGGLIRFGISMVCLILTVTILLSLAGSSGDTGNAAQNTAQNFAVVDRYNMFFTNTLSDTMGDILSIKKVYWLNDDDLVSPEPNQDLFGTTEDPASLQWLLDDAAELLDGQKTLFTTETQIMSGSKVHYYLDETILAVTWKQVMDDAVYTISEVKIAHPSQFRRFLADGVYSSGSKYTAPEMAASVNAVVAANGDFYSFRNMGIIVYDSQLMRMEGRSMDTCFIDGNGDLRFAYIGDMTDKAQTQQFIEDNGVRFSLAFGPVLIDEGKLCTLKSHYPVGEGNIRYARAALCQYDTLHYLLVTVSAEPPYEYAHTIPTFADNLMKLGVDKAYNLDGGQSATLVMNDQKINYVWLRQISDIIYFATAVPSGG